MKYSLSIMERIVLSRLLAPHAGDIATLRLVRKLREDLSFTDAEHEQWGIATDQGMTRWEPCSSCVQLPDRCKHQTAEIAVNKAAEKLVKGILEKLNEDRQVTLETLPLLETFCPELVPEEVAEEVRS